jgi:hypothetical protein
MDQVGETLFTAPKEFQAARAAFPDKVIIIARWDDEQSHNITIQDFIRDGKPFIPVFTGEAAFKAQIKGSGFEDQGVSINTDMFLSMMRGGEHLIVDPAGDAPVSIMLPERRSE